MALIVFQKINNINKKNNIMESINALDCVEIKSFNYKLKYKKESILIIFFY